ncbi:TPA: hypothetical protein ACH3X2_010873 [Trebouxia sp. C0005]
MPGTTCNGTQEGKSAKILTRQQNCKFVNKVLADFLRYKKHEGRLWSLKELLEMNSSHLGTHFEYVNRNVLWAVDVWHGQGLPNQTTCKYISICVFCKSNCRKPWETILPEASPIRYLSRPLAGSCAQIGRHITSTSRQPC